MRFATATVLLFPALIAAAPQSGVASSAVAPSTAGQCSNNAPVQCCDNTRKLDINAVIALLKDLNLPIPADLGKAPTGLIPGAPTVPGAGASDLTGAVPAAPGTGSSGSAPTVPNTNDATGAVPATPVVDGSGAGADASAGGVDAGAGAGAGGDRTRGGRGRGGRGRGGRGGRRPSRHHDDYDYDYDYDYDHYNKAKRALLDGLNLGNTLNLGGLNVLQKIDVLNQAFNILNPVLVGTDCSPVNFLNIGSTCKSNQQPVCCQNNEFNGLVALGCTPINVSVL